MVNIDYHKSNNKHKRYFLADAGVDSVENKRIMPLLRQETPRTIILFLLNNPNSIHKEICNNVRKAPSTITFHLKKLIDASIIEEITRGKEKAYVVRNPDKIADLLSTYKASFLDKAVDKFVDAWAPFGKQ